MTIFFATLAITILLWFSWQLFQAKRFTRFKKQINEELKPKVIAHLKTHLEQQRCETYPNTDSHIEASIVYWSQYPVRIVQLAFAQKIIDQSWLEQTGNIRPCQHLYHVQHQFKAEFKLPLFSDEELSSQELSNQELQEQELTEQGLFDQECLTKQTAHKITITKKTLNKR